MASWAKEIMKLANDFCINTNLARKIVSDAEKVSVPNGVNESEYRYNKAHANLKAVIMNML